MESFASSGQFWLPQTPDRRVHGDLAFDDAGIQLRLAKTLRGPVVLSDRTVGGPMQWATEQVVHGRLRSGEEVTLLQASGLAIPVDIAQETWSASFALTGGLVPDDRFSRVQVDFDYLLSWARPPGIVRSELTDSNVTIDTDRSTLAEATLPDSRKVRLLTGVTGRRSHDSVHLDQWCAFELEGQPTPLAEILNDWVRPLQDLLVVCLGLPVRLGDVLLGAGRELRLFFEVVQAPATDRPLEQPEAFSSPALLTYGRSPVPFPTLMTEWFSLCERLPAAITLLCGPYYASFIYSQHRYASVFQSAEAIARAELGGREKEKSEHRLRVEAVTEALQASNLDEETVGWATRVLQGANHKPLRQLIEELIAATGEMGRQLLVTLPDLPQRAADARVGVSHPLDRRPGVLERHWIGEALVWVGRVHLLAQLGVDIAALSQSVTAKPMFEQVVAELRALTDAAAAASPTA
jgi:ApeA N-terminal domain 1